MSYVGKLTADFIAIIKFGCRESHLPSTQHQPISHAQNKQCNDPRVARHCLQISVLRTIFGGLALTLNIVIKVILICVICLNMLVNIMMLALKSGPQIASKTCNPASLLLRRIWYSVGESGVLGITEYRQGRHMARMLPREIELE